MFYKKKKMIISEPNLSFKLTLRDHQMNLLKKNYQETHFDYLYALKINNYCFFHHCLIIIVITF